MSESNEVRLIALDETDSLYQQVFKNVTYCHNMRENCDVDIDCLLIPDTRICSSNKLDYLNLIYLLNRIPRQSGQ